MTYVSAGGTGKSIYFRNILGPLALYPLRSHCITAKAGCHRGCRVDPCSCLSSSNNRAIAHELKLHFQANTALRKLSSIAAVLRPWPSSACQAGGPHREFVKGKAGISVRYNQSRQKQAWKCLVTGVDDPSDAFPAASFALTAAIR